jgi:hypothetical protein
MRPHGDDGRKRAKGGVKSGAALPASPRRIVSLNGVEICWDAIIGRGAAERTPLASTQETKRDVHAAPER